MLNGAGGGEVGVTTLGTDEADISSAESLDKQRMQWNLMCAVVKLGRSHVESEQCLRLLGDLLMAICVSDTPTMAWERVRALVAADDERRGGRLGSVARNSPDGM